MPKKREFARQYRRDKIEVEIIEKERDVVEAICQGGEWAWRYVNEDMRRWPAFPHAPTSRAAVTNFIEWWKATRKKPGNPNGTIVTYPPNPVGAIAWELRQKGYTWHQIALLLGRKYGALKQTARSWRRRVGLDPSPAGQAWYRLRILKEGQLGETQRREDALHNPGLPDPPRSANGAS